MTITDRGRPVARMTAIPASRLEGILEAGQARPARRRIADLPAPEEAPSGSDLLAAMRDDDLC